MVGPFMQGLFLMGIIYWYSKGMLSMINDYYRSEFHRNLKEDDVKVGDIRPAPDIDDFSELMKIEESFIKQDKQAPENVAMNEQRSVCRNNRTGVASFIELLVKYRLAGAYCSKEIRDVLDHRIYHDRK